MVSLTPGALANLLSGDREMHRRRSTLLQVIEIAPSISASDESDSATWLSPGGGFFLKLSDSANSAYVSVSDEVDAELVRNDAVRLGQFVHVARLDTAATVPELRGLRPVPRGVRKPCPCIGNPVELVSSEALFRNSDEKKRFSFDSCSQRRSWGSTKNVAVSPLASPKKVPTLKHSNSFGLPLGSKNGTVPPPKKEPKSPPELSGSLKKVSPKNVPSLKHSNSFGSLLGSKNGTVPPSKKETKSPSEIGESLKKVTFDSKPGPGQKISWDTLPSTITELGKKTAHQRGVAFLAAVRSLEEASAADDVIHCMCIFAELCKSSRKSPVGQVVQNFMDLNHRLLSAAKLADSLLNSDPTAHHHGGSSSWVKAALKTNLASFNLFENRDKEDERHRYIVLESPHSSNKEPKNNYSPQIKKIQRTLSSSAFRKEDNLPKQQRNRKLKNETASLAQKLLLASRDWFLGFLEDSFAKWLGPKRDESLSGQLKRIEQWLDYLVTSGSLKDEKRVVSLRKKLHGFSSDHRARFGN